MVDVTLAVSIQRMHTRRFCRDLGSSRSVILKKEILPCCQTIHDTLTAISPFTMARNGFLTINSEVSIPTPSMRKKVPSNIIGKQTDGTPPTFGFPLSICGNTYEYCITTIIKSSFDEKSFESLVLGCLGNLDVLCGNHLLLCHHVKL